MEAFRSGPQTTLSGSRGQCIRHCLGRLSNCRNDRLRAFGLWRRFGAGAAESGAVTLLLELTDVNWPRVLLGIWLVLTIGWLGIAGYDLYRRWPEYYAFYKRSDGLLIHAMVRVDLTESLGFALAPPIVSLLIGWVVLWRGPRR